MSKIRETNDLNKWRDISCLIIGTLIVKMAVLLQMMYRFLTISMKILLDFLKAQMGKLILEFIWKYKGY